MYILHTCTHTYIVLIPNNHQRKDGHFLKHYVRYQQRENSADYTNTDYNQLLFSDTEVLNVQLETFSSIIMLSNSLKYSKIMHKVMICIKNWFKKIAW